MKERALVVFWVLCSIPLLAQKPELDAYIEDIVEEMAASGDDEVDLDGVLSDLEFFYSNPLNLNSASEDELNRLFVLNDFQVASLLAYRKRVHKIMTLNELRYIYGFNDKVVDLIAPIVYCGSVEAKKINGWQDLMKRSSHELLFSSSYNSQTKTKGYEGSPIQQYTRYVGKFSDKLKLGFIADKDAGEAFFSGTNRYGADFYSGFLEYSSNKVLKNMVLGDYRVRLSQGLLVWNGFSSGKSAEISTLKKRGQGVSGNTSKDEYNYMRGFAASLSRNGTLLDVWVSQKKLDGVVDSIDGQGIIRSINTTGYHRTRTEIDRKGNTGELAYGISLAYHMQHFRLRLNGLHTQYSEAIVPAEDIYKLKDFTGESYTGASIGYNALFQMAQLYGEWAYGYKGMAGVSGINFMPTTAFTATMFYRYYDPGYYSPYANGLVESGKTRNEEGFFGGINWQTDWNVSLSAYADLFSFPWASYSADQPTNGRDYQVQANYKTYSGLNFLVRYKYKEKGKNNKVGEEKTNEIEISHKQDLRFHAGYTLSEQLRMASRVEWAESGATPEESNMGYLIYQDFIFAPFFNTTIYFRYARFQVDNYSARIFAYENDALYAYSMPAYYGEGQKVYLLLKQKLSGGITVWLRYAHTGYFTDDYKDKDELRAQVLLKF